MDFGVAYDWEAEGDQFSFEDSDRFDDDSMCSWMSEPESLCNNWRGWKKQNGGGGGLSQYQITSEGDVTPLVELAAKVAACHIPFEEIEKFYPPIPENLQLRITFWSFPENEDDLRMYSCLANGSAEEFQKGEHLYKAKAVKDALQIGFHLSATVIPPPSLPQTKGTFNVAIVFDRRRITHTNCTCGNSSWCAHVVAVCLLRIHQPHSVCQRAPVSESLTRLTREQLQKFAQYLISALPQQILPTAQRLLDELLSCQTSSMNVQHGAPDPTAGPSSTDHTSWCLDEDKLHENIKKTLSKFSVPSPIVFSDVNFLSSTAPPASAEYSHLLRPLRGREPEGMWNLLSIVREIFKRHDSNAASLLEILTEEVLQHDPLLIWWFTVKTSASHNSANVTNMRANSTNISVLYASSSLCDEIVGLWRLAALNPELSPINLDDILAKLKDWHILAIDKVRKARGTSNTQNTIKKADIELFSGFKHSIEACQLTWTDYPIPAVTYIERDTATLSWKQSCLRYDGHPIRSHTSTNPIPSTDIYPDSNVEFSKTQDLRLEVGTVPNNDARNDEGSSSSEGFCEGIRGDLLHHNLETDSDLADNSDISQTIKTFKKVQLERGQLGGMVPAPVDNPSLPQEIIPSIDKPSDELESDISVSDKVLLEKDTPMHPCSSSNDCSNHAVVSVEALDQSESDEYQMYYFDPLARVHDGTEKSNEEPNYFAGMKKLENKLDILFARCEGLHAHGFMSEACTLARKLAEEMLDTKLPDLMLDKTVKKKKISNSTSSFASTTLAKAAFLCSVLLEDSSCHHLAFKIGMFGLEMPRQPASNKALEVKLSNQESELVTLLKKIPLGLGEVNVIRERAEQLRDNKLQSRGEALLPLMLATFIFDSLCMAPVQQVNTRQIATSKIGGSFLRLTADEKLGFDAAVTALGLKSNVSEAEHPLLCESIRRQRGDLTITMLINYKDDQTKLSRIMDKLLDKEIHQLYKAPSLSNYLSKPYGSQRSCQKQTTTAASENSMYKRPVRLRDDQSHAPNQSADSVVPENPDFLSSATNQSLHYLDLEPPKGTAANVKSTSSKVDAASTSRADYHSKDTDSSAVEEDSVDCKKWEAKFRSSILGKSGKKHPHGHMASIDSSAPETTSSDNSPTLVRRQWSSNSKHHGPGSDSGRHHGPGSDSKHHGPGSDSGSSEQSSDSFGSSGSGVKGLAKSNARDIESPVGVSGGARFMPTQVEILSRSSTPNMKGARFSKGKRAMPTIPNQPSEALAHFMFELAKNILNKAGGNSSTSLFTHPSANNVHTTPHRALQICAFQIGLYALGLHNCVSANWLSRTYSSHVSWIIGQAMEIGSAAVSILIDTWEGHLTPTEVAHISDRASRGRDPNMVKAASALALSCLPHAHALNPNEIARALIQCKEQSQEMLEKACLAVENAAKGGGVYPEVLFNVARLWFEMYEKAIQVNEGSEEGVAEGGDNNQQALVPVSGTMSPAVSGPPPMTTRTSPPNVIQIPISNSIMQPPATVAVQLPFTIQPAPPGHIAHPYSIPAYSYVQTLQPFGAPYTQALPAYIQAYSYQGQTHFNPLPAGPAATHVHIAATHNSQAAMLHPSSVHLSHAGTPVQPFVGATIQTLPNQPLMAGQLTALPIDQQANVSHVNTGHLHMPNHVNTVQMNYILAAYRVGMLAMETLGRRVHDDRPHTKYARSPPYGEDVKWALSLAMKLGSPYLQQFCGSVVNAVVSPFVLQDIAHEMAYYLSRHSPSLGQISSNIRSPILTSLIQKCLQMFVQCAHQRLHHITQTEYDEFVNIMCHARTTFCMSPGGMVQFNELLQSIRRAKACKKELWTRIVNGLAGNHLPQ